MKLTRLNELIRDGRVVKGRWELSPRHEIQYRSEDPDEEIKLKGSLVATEPGALVISVTEKQSDQKSVTSLWKLTGSWRANSKNEILFEVEKESGKKDALTFASGWRLTANHQILYTYGTETLKKRDKIMRSLLFEGHWELSDKNRLTYRFGVDSRSAFQFRGAFETKSIYAKAGEIRYQLGIGARRTPRTRTVSLFGKWKISRDFGLSFEIEGNKRTRALTFGGEYRLTKNDEVAVNLKVDGGKPLGVELLLTRDLFKNDGQIFIRLQKSLEESRIEAGIRSRW